MLKQYLLIVSVLVLVLSLFSCKTGTKKDVEVPDASALVQQEQVSPLSRIYFDYDKYNIRPDAAQTLASNAEYLKQNPNVKIQIEGHCDERGSNDYNLALGQKRASAAKAYLVKLGISPNRISTISYGEERPLVNESNEDAWAQNRRAEFVILNN